MPLLMSREDSHPPTSGADVSSGTWWPGTFPAFAAVSYAASHSLQDAMRTE